MSKLVDWAELLPLAIEQAQAYKKDWSEPPTLRGLFYRLVSIEALPNILTAYKGLSRELSKHRKSGAFPWSLLQDKTRDSINKQKDPTSLQEALSWASTEVEDSLDSLERAFNDIQEPEVDFRPHRWDGQPKRVVIALEKEAVSGAVQKVVRRLGIEIFPMKGYSSTTFIKKMATQIKELNESGEVQLLIITDYDPSGEDIARFVEETLEWDFGAECQAEKILLTKDQILEHDLPAVPESAKERAKMQRDSRFANWEDGFYRVELDAMAAIVPDAFRACIKEAVAKHFDEDIYRERQAEAKEACSEAEEELRELYEQLEEVHEQVSQRVAEIRGE